MSTLKGFFKDTIVYGIAAVLPRVINFLLVRVHTDALPADNYAENTEFYIWAALCAVVLTFGMETAFFRFYTKVEKKDVLISTAFISMLLSVFAFIIVVLIFFDSFLLVFDFQNNPFRLKMFIAILVLDTLAMVPFAYLRAANKPIKYALIKLVNVGVIVLINLIFLKYIPAIIEQGEPLPSMLKNNFDRIPLVEYIFIANVVGSAVSLCCLLPYLMRFRIQFDKQLLLRMLSYSWPIAVAGIAYIINENLDKLLIGRMIGATEMGVYSACYKLAIFMNLYIMAFRLGAEPFFFNQANKKNAKETYARILNYFVIIGALVLVIIVVFIDFIKELFINNDAYWGALFIVPIILLANLFLGIYHNLAIWYKLTDKTRYGMYFSIIGAVITITVNLILIPILGIIAAALATLMAYFVMALMSYWIGKKYYPINYNLKKIGLYLVLAIGICLLSFLNFRENIPVSIGFVVAFSLIIAANERKDIISIIKSP